MENVLARPQVKLIKYDDDIKDLTLKVRIIIYARFSTDNQSSSSTEDQIRLIRRAANLAQIKSALFPGRDFEIVAEFKDEAVSGFGVVGRDGLDSAMNMIRNKQADVILVSDFKRFLRGMGIALQLFDFLNEYGAELLAISDGFSSAQKNARLMFMNKAYASEEFLESVSIDTQRGLNERRYEGFSDGHLWFGVTSKPTRQTMIKGKLKDSHFEYVILENQASVVRRIFKMSADGLSQREIAKILNDECVPCPACYYKTGAMKEHLTERPTWADRTIYQILNNKSYIGIIERGKTKIIKKSDGTKQTIDMPKSNWIVIDSPNLKIIDQELWDSVRERFHNYNLRKLKSGNHGKPFRHDGQVNHIFTSLCSCEVCNGPIVVVTGHKGGYYGCRNAHRQKSCVNHKVISWKKLEVPILNFLVEQLKSDDVCKILAQKYNELRKSRISKDVGGGARAAEKLADVEGSISNIIKAIAQGAVSETLIVKLKNLEDERNSLKGKIEFLGATDQKQIYITPLVIKERFQGIPELLRTSQPFEINKALRPLLGKQGIKILHKISDDPKGTHWAEGSLNLGKALTLVKGLGYGDSASIKHEIPFMIQLV